MLKQRTRDIHTISPNQYCIMGLHKRKGQRKGRLRFDTYWGAERYLKAVVAKHKLKDNYIMFWVEGA